MNQLLNLQHDFQDYLLNENSAIKDKVIGTEKVSIETRLGIYRNAYYSRLIEALAYNFPALHVYLGDDVFKATALAFIKQYPSTFRSIRWFGHQFPEFIKEYLADQPYLAELALIEWTMTIVFDEMDAVPIELEIMNTIQPDDWGNIRLTFHPTVKMLALSWDVIPLWKKLIANETPDMPKKADQISYVFWRKDLVNQFCSLQVDESSGLTLMQKNATFSDLCEHLCESMSEDDAIMRAASLLKSWISSGLIIAVNI